VVPRDSWATADPHLRGFDAAREAHERGAAGADADAAIEAGGVDWAGGAAGGGAAAAGIGAGEGGAGVVGDFSATGTGAAGFSGSETGWIPLG
jgi:fibronectin-binding autotransporter adhesin